jgi:hypothetical protein
VCTFSRWVDNEQVKGRWVSYTGRKKHRGRVTSDVSRAGGGGRQILIDRVKNINY